ncbi:hypothetical protein [Actinoplanes sp. M2I2]|uniref:hypothetical protein n=1 Tax=Actinoplanes sp. M2I2 TaxID=1734444 RepID=UPI002020CEBE|nr:hypothetical protein [Actinoplanes sp. M2I2]
MTDVTSRPTNAPGRWRRIGAYLMRLWRRFVAAFQGPEVPLAPPPPAPGRLTERRSIAPLAVPARGFAFDFQIDGTFVWTSDGLDRSDLRSLVETFLPYARGHLKGVAAGLARGVEPHRGEDFERRLRSKLAEMRDWTYERQGLRVRCRAHVRVRLDDRIQEHIRPYWERMIELDYERDIAARRARHVDRVSAQWAAVLERLLKAPVPGGAATMTDEQLAKVVREHLGEQRAWEDALAGLGPQDEYRREGFFDLLTEEGRRPA